MVGVKSQANDFYVAKLVSQDIRGQHFEVAVPQDRALRLSLFSRNLGIVDANNTPLNHLGAELPFQARAGVTPVFTVSVTQSN